MTKFGGLLGRRPVLVVEGRRRVEAEAGDPAAHTQESRQDAEQQSVQDRAAGRADVLELDQDLFFPVASQLGEENEVVRNLLIDAEHKISELEGIKKSIGKLVDPVSKTLRAFEEAKSEKLTLQGTLNNTRVANARLRDQLTAAEKKVSVLESEGARLREAVTIAQQSARALEDTRVQQAAELTERRSQIADLHRHVQQQGAELQIVREEAQRAGERVAQSERRMVQLEAQAAAAQQKLMLAEQERTTVQGVLDKTLAEQAQLSRRLLDTENALRTAQARLKQVEADHAEAHGERCRLAVALDEANQRHRDETNTHRARFEALQSRAQLGDKLLEEARQTLTARADEIGAYERRVSEATLAHSAIETRLVQFEGAVSERDAQIKELERACAALTARNDELVKAIDSRESAYRRAQEHIQSQETLVSLLEGQLRAAQEASELHTEEMASELQRERLERSMAEGALEAGRKDIARLLRELAALQHRPSALQSAEAALAENLHRLRSAA